MTSQAVKGEPLDWKSLKVVNEFVDKSRIVIHGETSVPMRVELLPDPVGVAPVEYQPIRLLGFRDDIGPDVVKSFTIDRELNDFPHGTVGIKVIGATMQELIPPREDADA